MSMITSQVAEVFDEKNKAVIAFLRAVDEVMNSNTILLKGKTEKLFNLTARSDLYDFFRYFMKNHFTDLFLEYDRISEWDNYHEWDEEVKTFVPNLHNLIRSDARYKLKPMSYLSFVERLHCMLCTGYSPYHKHLNEDDAQIIIANFLSAIFPDSQNTINSLPKEWVGIPRWVKHNWQFYDVVPDFLQSSGYWTAQDTNDSSHYFDGGDADSCTFFYHKNTFYLLLTNGCP